MALVQLQALGLQRASSFCADTEISESCVQLCNWELIRGQCKGANQPDKVFLSARCCNNQEELPFSLSSMNVSEEEAKRGAFLT